MFIKIRYKIVATIESPVAKKATSLFTKCICAESIFPLRKSLRSVVKSILSTVQVFLIPSYTSHRNRGNAYA